MTNQTVTVIVGGFYGDEGKGKIVAAVASREKPTVVARAGVGTNAGHTIVHENKKYGIRQIPSAVFDCPDAKFVIGPGVLVDPIIAVTEIKTLGLTKDNIAIDNHCPIIEDHHITQERANYNLMHKIGSTGSGSGAAWADHVMRSGPIARDNTFLTEFVGDAVGIVHGAIERNENVLIEGTQATFLSLYHGEYPWCTSKDVCASSLCADVGVGPLHIKDVIVVFKAFITRVGNGYLENEISVEEMKERGWDEYGTVTGRPRRAAPFDFKLAKKSIMLNSASKIAICKVDVLFPEVEGITEKEHLSTRCLEWIKSIEDGCGIPVYCIGTGPDAKHTVFMC